LHLSIKEPPLASSIFRKTKKTEIKKKLFFRPGPFFASFC
jgi:hypothetical protein